jgi:uncharacterized membrane protein
VINVTVRTEINVPADEGFAYVSDFSKNVEWQVGIESTDWISDPPIRVGSTYRQVAEYRDTETIYEVTAIDPGRSITTESRDGATFPVSVTRTVDALGEARCRITVDLVGYPRGFRRVVQSYVERVVRRSIESDYRRLKRNLESAAEDV